MFRRASAGARSLMPNVDGWDVLLWMGVLAGFVGIWGIAGIYAALVALAVVMISIGFLGSSAPRRPTPPPES